MKKILSTIVAIAVMLSSISTYAAAQTYTTDITGVSFDMPDHWTCTDSDAEYVRFAKFGSDDLFEAISMEYAYIGTYLNANDVEDEIFKNAIEAGYLGDDAIKDWLKSSNPSIYGVSVSTIYENQERVTYGQNDYYRYERNVNISAYGYNTMTLYFTMFVTVHNGYLYCYRYQRDPEINNSGDVIAALSSVRYNDRDITIIVNDKTIQPDTEPVILEGRTMVPIRAVAEELGYDVEWEPERKIVTIKNEFNTVYFGIDMSSYIIGDAEGLSEEFEIEVAPFISGGRTYLPLRAVSDALGADIDWDPETYTVTIEADTAI